MRGEPVADSHEHDCPRCGKHSSHRRQVCDRDGQIGGGTLSDVGWIHWYVVVCPACRKKEAA